jgi:hypothetical protein
MAYSYENVNLRKQNFAADKGYFYTFDDDQDSLLQKTDDGNTAFSYPLDTLLSEEIVSTEFDGVYFWTLEPGAALEVIIRKWKIENYICTLKDTISFSDYGDSEAFSIQHYHTSLANTTNSGSTTVYLNKYSDHSSMTFTTTSGDPLVLHLGPNSSGQEEDIQVGAVISGGITLTSGTSTQYDYDENDSVNYYTYLWLFNNYYGADSNTGALYKIDPYTYDQVASYAGGAYKNIKAATFYNVDSFIDYGPVDTLVYIKNTNALFINIEDTPLLYYGSMALDNVKKDEATVIDIYDITMDDQNVYRLQKYANYYDEDYSWTYYNYQLSSLDSFVTSISLAAYPAIIAANGINTSIITARVKDQFLQPIVSRLVTFSDDDDNGSVAPLVDNTDADGEAGTVYTSGTEARVVTITAVVEQT